MFAGKTVKIKGQFVDSIVHIMAAEVSGCTVKALSLCQLVARPHSSVFKVGKFWLLGLGRGEIRLRFHNSSFHYESESGLRSGYLHMWGDFLKFLLTE